MSRRPKMFNTTITNRPPLHNCVNVWDKCCKGDPSFFVHHFLVVAPLSYNLLISLPPYRSLSHNIVQSLWEGHIMKK